jgi:2-keto-3-deoxy-L-rhamnonate aldolase RhmA
MDLMVRVLKTGNVLFVCPADLSLSYAIPMQLPHPLIQQAIARVANAVAKAGKWWGTVTVTLEAAQTELDRGPRMVTCVDDHFALVRGLQKAYSQFAHIGVREKR